MTSLYGPIITGGQVRAAYQATLTQWLPAYLAEVSRQTGLTLPPVRHYSTGVAPNTPIDELPAIVLVAPGVDGAFTRRGGVYDAPWGVGVGPVVAHALRDTACAQAEAYTAAVRACILQHGSLGGFATDTVLQDEEITQVAWNTDYAVWAGALYFTSTVTGVVDATAGPSVPPSPDATIPLQAVAVSATHLTTKPTVP